MEQIHHACQRCGCRLEMGRWYCDSCLALIGRRDRWEELADRMEAAEEREKERER